MQMKKCELSVYVCTHTKVITKPQGKKQKADNKIKQEIKRKKEHKRAAYSSFCYKSATNACK